MPLAFGAASKQFIEELRRIDDIIAKRNAQLTEVYFPYLLPRKIM